MMPYIVQTLMGAIGSVGFAVLFNVRGKRLAFFFLGGALDWAVYLVCIHNGTSMFLSVLFAAMTAGLFSEVLARIIHAPVLLLLVPTLVPLIPGSDLYYCMDAMIRSDNDVFIARGTAAITVAGAIGLGIICTTAVSHIALSIADHLRKHRKLTH